MGFGSWMLLVMFELELPFVIRQWFVMDINFSVLRTDKIVPPPNSRKFSSTNFQYD